jgi:hypothetical protein
MANGYDDTNKGVLFRNEQKQKDNQPDMTGKVNVDGVEFRVAAWTREAKSSGKKFLSLAVEPAEQQASQQPAKQQPAQDFDDAIPF